MSLALEMKDFSYTYPGARIPAIRDTSCFLDEGECICVTGPSGCGKTTLLLAVQGLLRGGHANGTISLKKNGCRLDAGMVFQNADTQILCTTVEDEVAFGPENLHFLSEKTREKVLDALSAVGLTGFEKRNVEQLSAGEKHRLTIASVLSMEPRLLLLDEPTSQLDADGKKKLLEIIKGLKERGHSLLITDHNHDLFRPIADRFIFMRRGHIVNEVCDQNIPAAMNAGQKPVPVPDAPDSIAVTDLYLSGVNGNTILNGVNLRINRGELIHVFGQNGAGKSTFLKCIAGLISRFSGTVRITGIGTPQPDRLLGKIGVLFQNPQRQIFEDTVYEEIAFSLRRMRLPNEEIHDRVMNALTLCDISDLSERPPLTLSFGEQHRVALASVIAPHPEILLLDEPFSGLDLAQRYRILRILSELRQECGTTIVIASHDLLPDPHWADRTLSLQGGKIERL